MRQKSLPVVWLLIALFLTLFLVACERPLQDEADLTLEPSGPAEGTLPAYPGAETPVVPGLLPTPTQSAPGAGEGEQTPGAEGTSAAPAAEPTPSGPVIHTVVAGDTLGDLATQYGVTVEDIAAANDLPDVHTLEVGQQLLIPIGGLTEEGQGEEPAGEETGGEEAQATEPAPTEPAPAEERVHIVAPGDTLFRIGQQYGFTIEELATYNSIANPDRLEVGQQIRIPPEGYTIEP